MWTRADVEAERKIEVERRRFAAGVDRALRRAEGQQALARAALGAAAGVLLRTRTHEHLGFVRLRDYCRERFGCSARQLQIMAQVVRRLGPLSGIRAAFLEGDLSWTQARLLAAVATEVDEAAWLARARGTTVRELRAVVDAHVAAGRGNAALAQDEDTDPTLDGEQVVRVRLACPARLRVLWRYAIELGRRMAGESGPRWQAIEAIAAEGLSGASRAGRRAAADCPAPWRHRSTRREEAFGATAEGPRRTDEAPTGSGAVADGGPEPGPRTPPRGSGSHRGGSPASDQGAPPDPSDAASDDGSSLDGQLLRGTEAFDAACADTETLAAGLDRLGPRALDARLGRIDQVLRTGNARVGRLLALVGDLRLHRTLGFASLDAYVTERLAMSVRKARTLIAVERACARAPVFAAAYRDGRISSVQAERLLPVLDRTTEAVWVAYAGTVTVRLLEAAVAWALDRRDLLGPDADLMPPPVDAPLGRPGAPASETAYAAPEDTPETGSGGKAESDPSRPPGTEPTGAPFASAYGSAGAPGAVRPPHTPVPVGPSHAAVPKIGTASASDVHDRAVQMDAREADGNVAFRAGRVPHSGTEICDGEIDFVAPVSVATLWRGALIAFSPPGAPRWEGLARLLRHVVDEWEGQPRLRDPIFARDGFLCTVPGCSGRRNLQDHHLRFRSRGGGNERANRTTVCAAHHLRAIHRGRVRAWGRAPGAIRWDLGVQPDGAAFLRLLGDRYLEERPAA